MNSEVQPSLLVMTATINALGWLLAWRLASAPRREGTLGKLRLSPIAEVLRAKAKAEQAEPAVAG